MAEAMTLLFAVALAFGLLALAALMPWLAIRMQRRRAKRMEGRHR